MAGLEANEPRLQGAGGRVSPLPGGLLSGSGHENNDGTEHDGTKTPRQEVRMTATALAIAVRLSVQRTGSYE